jgi:hypothetical protein
MQIPGIPESIPRATYLELIRSLGFEWEQLRHLEFTSKGIRAQLFALDKHGQRFMTRDGDGLHVAMHEVFVRIDGEDES